MKPLIVIPAIIAASVASSSHAMQMCADRDRVVASLTDQYSEKHLASGLQSSSGLMEIWVSETDGTWTILLTQPDGRTCIMASGTHWLERDAMPVSGEPA